MSKTFRININYKGQSYEFYRHASTELQARLIAIRVLEATLGRVRGSLSYEFNGRYDNIIITEVYITRHNQIKEV